MWLILHPGGGQNAIGAICEGVMSRLFCFAAAIKIKQPKKNKGKSEGKFIIALNEKTLEKSRGKNGRCKIKLCYFFQEFVIFELMIIVFR